MISANSEKGIRSSVTKMNNSEFNREELLIIKNGTKGEWKISHPREQLFPSGINGKEQDRMQGHFNRSHHLPP